MRMVPPPVGRLVGFAMKSIKPGHATFAMRADERHHTRTWGAARKALNLFLRDVQYSWDLSSYFGLHTIFSFLEVPLDRYVAQGLCGYSEFSHGLPRCARQTGSPVVLMGIRNATTLFAIHGETDMHLESRKLVGHSRLVAGALLSLSSLASPGRREGLRASSRSTARNRPGMGLTATTS
jgi:hypothetical protein